MFLVKRTLAKHNLADRSLADRSRAERSRAERTLAKRSLARRVRARQAVALGFAGVVASSATLAAVPAGAVETYLPSGSTVTLSGHGFGHGHGMSQWGAYGAASVGKLSWQNIVAFYYPGTTLANLGNPTIRVRLDSAGSGPTTVFNAAGLRLAGKALPGGAITQYRARSLPAAGRMQIEALTGALWKPYAASATPAVFSSSTGLVDVKLAGGTRRAYRGSVYAHRATATSVRTVSVLPMESYLRAVVPAEMPASWHPNALRSQAVAARSYANYDRVHSPSGRTYDTCDTTSCQMYSGVPAEYTSSSAAVAATSGQTLTYGGAATFTQFGAANGGWMSSGGKPYLTSKADPYDGAIPNNANAWTSSISVASIQARWPSIGTYRGMRIISRDGGGAWGGRVLSAAIDGSSGSVAVTGATIRSAFGLRSEWFIPTNGGVAASSMRDFSGDRRADVLAVKRSTGALWMYAGNGASGWRSQSVIGTGFNGTTKFFTAGTWNNDPYSDVMAQRSNGSLWLYPGSASGPLGQPVPVGSGWGTFNTIFWAGDFTSDGRSDLLARKSDGSLWLYAGNGLGGFRFAGRKTGSGWDAFNVLFSPGDFNGDRKADVITRTRSGLLYLYPGNGSGGWLRPRLIGQGWNMFSTITSSGDFNGDGKSDLLARDSHGTLWLYPGNGTGGFGARKAVGSGWNVFSKILS
ncbi:MAG: stage sporulation protein [Actinomycetota bacterium]|nr:stage sporulation protein [Actinomycetota bacterium]